MASISSDDSTHDLGGGASSGDEDADQRGESIELQGELKGHDDWVTCIATAFDDKKGEDYILSGSRDKTILKWSLKKSKVRNTSPNKKPNDPEFIRTVEGTMERRLKGHSHFVSDIDISDDQQYALSGSWDGTLRLWNLKTGDTHWRFTKNGHKKDVLSVAFSPDNREIVSGSRDRSIKVWNTVGECHKTLDDHGSHVDWVTCVQFSPTVEDPVIVSSGRDRLVKVWNMQDMSLKHDLIGHTGYVNAVTVSPDGSLCASGGRDGAALLWDLHEGNALSNLDAGGEIHALCFSPNRYWLCGAVGDAIKIWDLETKLEVGTLNFVKETPDDDEMDEKKKKRRTPLPIICTCLAWSKDGKTLFAGYSDCKIRVWALISGSDDY